MKEFEVTIKGTLTVSAKDKDAVHDELFERLLSMAYDEDLDTLKVTKIKEKKG